MRNWLVALLALIVAPAPVRAYSISLVNGGSGSVVRWHTSNISYFLHTAGSADIVDGSDLGAVRAGFQQWNSVQCSKLQFTDAGGTSNNFSMAVGGAPNNKNEVHWAEGPEWELGAYVLGVTQTSFSVPSGEIQEADIAFNGYLNKWSTTGASGRVDVLNVAAHEEGHFFGAQHVLGGYDPNNPPTMAPTADPYLKSRTIEADDKLVACFLNPATEYTCKSDTDCPYVVDRDPYGQEAYVGKVSCATNGLCGGVSANIPEGTKTLGQDCASDYDCKNPLFCQPTGFDQVCAKDCNTDANCGAGFKCYPYSNGPGGVCLPYSGGGTGGGTTPGPTKGPGETCNSPEECTTGLCVGSFGSTSYYCRKSCTLGGSTCGAGETCTQLQGTSVGACIPGSGSSGTKPPGATCQSPLECLSGLCVGGGTAYYCRETCKPSLNDCPSGTECMQLLGTADGACIPADPKAELGAACEYQDDCITNVCLGIVGTSGSFCTQACTTPETCPCGMQCTAFQSGERFCVPGGPQACVPSGNPCQSAAECVSQACVDGLCRDTCQLGGGGCPTGQTCQRAKAGSTSGFCAPKGATPVGESCSADAECITLLCESHDGARCGLPCVSGSTWCGPGAACLLVASAGVHVCGPAPAGGTDTGTGGGATTGTDSTAGGTTAGGTGGSSLTPAPGGTTGGSTGALVPTGGQATGSKCQSGTRPGSPAVLWLCILALAVFRRRLA